MPIYRLPPYRVSRVMTALSETIPWSLTATNVPAHWTATRGKGVIVGVADTGVLASHPDLLGQVLASRDFSGSPHGAVDAQGHGTHCSGTIAAIQGNTVGVAGVAPDAKLVCAKVLGDDGSGRDEWISAGIDWLVTSGVHVISLSLGSPDPSPVILAALQRAVSAGVFVVAAAGNEGRPNSVNYPAAYGGMVAVSAFDRDGRLADFSSRGPQVVVAAPGQDIVSTYLRGGYASLSGTSMATPFVAGVVALLLARNKQHDCKSPVKTQRDLIEHLRRTAKDAGPVGHDDSFGWGLVNPDTFLADGCSPTPGAPESPPGGPPPAGPAPGADWQGAEYDIGVARIHIPAKPGDAMSLTV